MLGHVSGQPHQAYLGYVGMVVKAYCTLPPLKMSWHRAASSLMMSMCSHRLSPCTPTCVFSKCLFSVAAGCMHCSPEAMCRGSLWYSSSSCASDMAYLCADDASRLQSAVHGLEEWLHACKIFSSSAHDRTTGGHSARLVGEIMRGCHHVCRWHLTQIYSKKASYGEAGEQTAEAAPTITAAQRRRTADSAAVLVMMFDA